MVTFSFCTSVHCGSVVMEKENRIIYSLKSMGMRPTTYWLSNFHFDYAFYLVVAFSLIFFVNIAELPDIKDENFGNFNILVLSYGVSQILFAYCWSFIFNKSLRAYIFYSFIQFLLGYALPTSILNIRSISRDKFQVIFYEKTFSFLFPLFNLLNGIEKLTLYPKKMELFPFSDSVKYFWY